MNRLDGKVAVITGAASGMGRLAVDVFVSEGAQVAALDLNVDHLLGTYERGGAVESLRCDVTSQVEVASAVDQVVERFGRIDALYNSAGVCDVRDESLLALNDDVWDRTMAINVKGTALCCKFTIPRMVKAGGGSIINVSSILGLVGGTQAQDAYSASKGAIISLTKSLAVQFGPQNVRTNAIAPGPIKTPMLDELLANDSEGMQKRLDRIPAKRLGEAGDVVQLAVYLASDESGWTNGAIIPVDGGITSNYY